MIDPRTLFTMRGITCELRRGGGGGSRDSCWRARVFTCGGGCCSHYRVAIIPAFAMTSSLLRYLGSWTGHGRLFSVVLLPSVVTSLFRCNQPDVMLNASSTVRWILVGLGGETGMHTPYFENAILLAQGKKARISMRKTLIIHHHHHLALLICSVLLLFDR